MLLILYLHNHDIVLLEQIFHFLGEVVVRNEYVDIFYPGKSVGIYFSYLGAVKHHIDLTSLFKYVSQKIAFYLRIAGKALFGSKCRCGNYCNFKIEWGFTLG